MDTKIVIEQISKVKGLVEYRGKIGVTKPETEKYVIVHNGKDHISLVHVSDKQVLDTGQPYMEVFETEEEAKSRYKELSGKIYDEEIKLIEEPIIKK